MKTLVKHYLFNLFPLWIVIQIIPAVSIKGDWRTLFIAAAILTFINFLVKPLVQLCLLPINFLTLGFTTFLVNAAMLYILHLSYSPFIINNWDFSGIDYYGFVVPAMQLGKFLVTVLAGFIVSWTSGFLSWISK